MEVGHLNGTTRTHTSLHNIKFPNLLDSIVEGMDSIYDFMVFVG